MALSILQNGPVPRFISENILQELFSVVAPSNPCVLRLREGLDKLGLVRIGTSLPTFSLSSSSFTHNFANKKGPG